MIAELKELVTVISHLPDYVMWVMAGFLFYKVFIIGNIYGILRLAINKIYEYAMSRKDKVIKHEMSFKGLTLDDGVDGILLSLLSKVRTESNKHSHYLRSADLLELCKAWEEFQQRKAKQNA